VRDGDEIAIDVEAGTVDLLVDAAEVAARLAALSPPEPPFDFGVFARYRACVASASEGAVLRLPGATPRRASPAAR
jgi:dihydroxy-acid dehydratase